MTGLAVITVAIAWLWIGKESVQSGAQPAKSTLYIMAAATTLTALAAGWPFLESRLL